jgi:hypothetical protein
MRKLFPNLQKGYPALSCHRDKEPFKACPLAKAMPGYAGRHRSMQQSDRPGMGRGSAQRAAGNSRFEAPCKGCPDSLGGGQNMPNHHHAFLPFVECRERADKARNIFEV